MRERRGNEPGPIGRDLLSGVVSRCGTGQMIRTFTRGGLTCIASKREREGKLAPPDRCKEIVPKKA